MRSGQKGPRWKILFAAFTGLTLFYTGVSYFLVAVLARERFQTKDILIWNATQFYLWIALAPLVIRLSNRRPVDRESWRTTLLFHLAASLLFSALQVGLSLSLYWLLDWPQSKELLPSFAMALQRAGQPFALGVIVYWVIVIANYGSDYYRRYREEQLRASRLEKDLVEAQLQALKMQLQPHFLFNALHSLSDLILEDADAAIRMVARLGDFLRLTLHGPNTQFTSLTRELAFARAYLEIERTRFHDRLQIIESIAEDGNVAQVPNLILQPLIENAIRHGISARVGAGRLRIAAQRRGPELIIEIEDDGPGVSVTPQRGSHGLGLANARRRLQQLYGTNQSLELTTGQWGGALVRLTLPFLPEETASASGELVTE